MAILFQNLQIRFLATLPLIVLLFISLNGSAIMDFKFFSININYILVYFWVLRQPATMGYGFIFISGIITDVVFGLPLGINALSLLAIATVATYVRVVTVNINLINDWISFIPALLIANLIYFISLYFSNIAIDYLNLFTNSVFTFAFYPILWGIFSIFSKIIKS
jgi:cell shape-determining protein MreD